jgi:hypothetical protein
MNFVADDACPPDWAEFNLPAELLKQVTAAVSRAELAQPYAEAAAGLRPDRADATEEREASDASDS